MRRSLPLLALVFILVGGPFAGPALAQSTASEPQSAGALTSVETATEDAVASKLFYAPTGRMLKRGEVYVAIDAFTIGVVRVGVTDRFSIGVGRPLWANTTWITPKFQIYEDDHTAIATGVLHVFAAGFGMGGVGYSVATIGSRDNAFTGGMGWFYGKDDDGLHVGMPVVIVGAEHRMGNRWKLITENYVFKDGAMLSAGGRLLRRNVSIELGGVFVLVGNTAVPGMVVNFVFHPAAARKN